MKCLFMYYRACVFQNNTCALLAAQMINNKCMIFMKNMIVDPQNGHPVRENSIVMRYITDPTQTALDKDVTSHGTDLCTLLITGS